MARPAAVGSASGALRLGLAYLLIASTVSRHSSGKTAGAEAPSPGAAGADAPDEITPRGWWDIARSVWQEIGNDRVVPVAAGLTFFAILAIFPAVTAIVSIYGLFGNPLRLEAQLQGLAGILPGGAITVITDQVRMIAAQGESKLSVAFVSSLAIAVWSANAGMKALFDALNVAYEVEESRGFFRLNVVSLMFTTCAVAVILAMFASTVVLPWLLQHLLGPASGLPTAITWLRWPLYLVIVLIGLAVLYRYGPARRQPAWRWITPGSLFACVGWIAASAAFAYYAANFGSYNQTYGTLGAIIGFMTWIWVSAIVIMVGAEINAETESQAKGETPSADKARSGASRA